MADSSHVKGEDSVSMTVQEGKLTLRYLCICSYYPPTLKAIIIFIL